VTGQPIGLMRLISCALFVAMFARLAGIGTGWLPGAPSLGAAAAVALALAGFQSAGPAATTRRLRLWAATHQFEIGLAALTVAALALRAPSLGADLGHHPPNIDEYRLAHNVKQYLATSAIGYHTVEHYPGILFWILAAASMLLYLQGLMDGAFMSISGMPVESFILAGRLTSVAAGAATVALAGLIGRQMAGHLAGWIAAALVAIAPLALATTTTNRNDPTQVLLLCAAVHAALASLDSKKRRWPALAGLFAGLATAVKYTSIFALVPALAAAGLRGDAPERARRAAISIAAFALALALTNHFLWWDVANFVRQLSDQVEITGPGHWAAMKNPPWYHAVVLSGSIGWALLALGAVTGAYALARGDRRAWVFWLLPILYSWFTTRRPSQFTRWVYPLLPFVAVAGAAGLVQALSWLRARINLRATSRPAIATVAVVAIGLALLAQPMWRGLSEVSRRINPQTHLAMERWVSGRPAGERVLVERGWLPLPDAAATVRRVPDMQRALGSSLYVLSAYDLVVISELHVRHPGLRQLSLVHRELTAPSRFGGRYGYDFFAYVPPKVPPLPGPINLRLDAADADRLLGPEWGAAEAGQPGRLLPASGAGISVPLASTGPVPITVIVTGPNLPDMPLAIADPAGPVALTAVRQDASRLALTGRIRLAPSGRPTEIVLTPDNRRIRVRVLQVTAG